MSYLALNLLSGFVVGTVAVLLHMPTRMQDHSYAGSVKLIKYFILGFSAGLIVIPLGALIQQEAVILMKQYPAFLLALGVKILTAVAGVSGFILGLSLGRKKAPEHA